MTFSLPEILIADDEIDSLDMVNHYFTARGWHVDAVETPNEMLRLFNERAIENRDQYDAIISDINFFGQMSTPRKTGISAISEIRRANRNIPVIFVSAYVNEITREQIELLGAGYLVKPVDLVQLYAKTVKAINYARLRPAADSSEGYSPVTASDPLQRIVQEARDSQKENQWNK